MGENLAATDRQAVRTPMQASDEPGAGFSTADETAFPHPLTEGEFGPLAVNVAQQRRDPGSLLNWFERLVRRRRESHEIGHGAYRHLPAGDPAVFAHRCDWDGRSLVAVHNLAGRAARAELALDLGDDLADRFGDRDVVVDDDGRVVLDLEPHDHRWYAAGPAAGIDVLAVRPGG